MPDHVAAKIVSLVFEDGVDMLKASIQSGPDGKAAVFSSETLSSVRLAPFFIHMAEESSSYHMFYTKCLTAEKSYALYLQRLVLAFHMFELHSCDGSIPWEFYIQYKRRYYKFSEVDIFADKLMFHINEVGPRRQGTYKKCWEFEDYGECWSDHKNLNEYEGQWCNTCIYYYMSQEIALIS